MKAVFSRSGVVYLKGKPGVGKTAITERLATDNGLRYMDLRLSMMAEEDMMIPTIKDGVIYNSVPEWAIEANKQPTLVVFEELNRATLPVRNASLQILLEKRIGINFKFNKNVYFMATGNLGEEDGTDIEDFDSALNNRLIHVNFTMSVDEWCEGYANEKVHPIVVQFLKNRPEEFYKFTECSAYATPRSWTFFSDLLKQEMGMIIDIDKIRQLSEDIGYSYVGKSMLPFINHLDNIQKININDVLDDFPRVEPIIKSFNRDVISLLLMGLKALNCNDLTAKQFKNMCDFLKLLSEDEVGSYLIHILHTEEFTDKKLNSYKLLFKEYKELTTKFKGLVNCDNN